MCCFVLIYHIYTEVCGCNLTNCGPSTKSTPGEEFQMTQGSLSLMEESLQKATGPDAEVMGGTLLSPHFSKSIDHKKIWFHLWVWIDFAYKSNATPSISH